MLTGETLMASIKCCDEILALFEDIDDDVDAIFQGDDGDYYDRLGTPDLMRLLDIVNEQPGVFVNIGACEVPSLSEIVNRIHNFGEGFHTWMFTESQNPGHTVITMPNSTTKYQVSLNSVRLTEVTDYTIIGAQLTLGYPLIAGDAITIKSYGG